MILRCFLLAASTTSVLAAPVFSQTKPAYGSWGYQPAAMDRSVKPGDDFWAFVNGSWDRTTQIAADRTSAGPFVTLSDASERDVRSIVEGFANAPKRDLAGQQIGDFYASFMDEAKVDSLGAVPLKPYFAQITAAQTRPQLLALFVATGFASPVGIGPAARPAPAPGPAGRSSARSTPARCRPAGAPPSAGWRWRQLN